MTEKELVNLEKFYGDCFYHISMGKAYGNGISNISKEVTLDLIIRTIFRYCRNFKVEELGKLFFKESSHWDVIIYGGPWFINNWNKMIDEFIDGLKYFEFKKAPVAELKMTLNILKQRSINETEKFLQKIYLNRKYIETIDNNYDYEW